MADEQTLSLVLEELKAAMQGQSIANPWQFIHEFSHRKLAPSSPASPATQPSAGGEATAAPPPASLHVAPASARPRSNSTILFPSTRDLDVTDPSAIETSLTSLHTRFQQDMVQLANIDSLDGELDENRDVSSASAVESAVESEVSAGLNSIRVQSISESADSDSDDDAGPARRLQPNPMTHLLGGLAAPGADVTKSFAILAKRLQFRARREEFYPETDPEPLVIAMVGLPARGKSFAARRICRYAGWQGIPCRIFNAGNYRRQVMGADQDASFFDPDNRAAADARERMAEMAAADLMAYIRKGGQIGIFDATNTVRARRDWVVDTFAQVPPLGRGTRLIGSESTAGGFRTGEDCVLLGGGPGPPGVSNRRPAAVMSGTTDADVESLCLPPL